MTHHGAQARVALPRSTEGLPCPEGRPPPCPSERKPRAAGSAARQDGAFEQAELPPPTMSAHPQLVAHLAPYDEGRVPAVIAAPARRDRRHVPALHLLDRHRRAEGATPLHVVAAPQVLDARRAHSKLHGVDVYVYIYVCVCV